MEVTEQYVEYKPIADGVAPRGWRDGMAWDVGKFNAPSTSAMIPKWESCSTYTVPAEALHYPIVPYKGELGADIAVNGRPDWLPDGQGFVVHSATEFAYYANEVAWGRITKIRLPASHGYYADNSEGSAGIPFNVDEWQAETKANLPAIEAAGYSVTFARDWAEQLYYDTRHITLDQALNLIRSRVRPVS